MRKLVDSNALKLVMAAMGVGFYANSYASGFQLFEANGYGTGDFYASAAAGAFDATTAFYNPAGLMFIPNQQIVLSAVAIDSNIDFKGSDTWTNPTATAALKGLLPPPAQPLLANSYTQSGSASASSLSVVPGFAYAAPINDSMAFGFDVAVPFGLETDYPDDSAFSYAATESAIQTIDLSPNIAFKFTDNLSFGVGVDAVYVDATLNSIAGLPNWAQLNQLGPNAYNTQSLNDASGWGYGWHTGIMYAFTPDTRVGVAYRSKVSVTLNGTSEFKGALAGGPTTLAFPVNGEYVNNNLTASTTLPASTLIGFYHAFNPVWSVDGTAVYTQWSVFNTLNLENVAAVNAMLGPESIEVIVPQDFRNSWRFALGVNFQPCQQWIIRGGLGYDETPTNDMWRNTRLPDGNRIAAGIGMHYQFNEQLGVDVGYTHLFFQDGDVNVVNTLGSQVTTTVGTAQSNANLVGLQLTWNLV